MERAGLGTESTVSAAELLARRERELRATLRTCGSTEESARAARNALREVRSELLNHLPLSDGRAADLLLEGVDLGLSALGGPARVTGVSSGLVTGPRMIAPWAQVIVTVLQLGVCVTLLLAPLNPPPIVWFIVLALAVLLGIELLLLLRTRLPAHWRAAMGESVLAVTGSPGVAPAPMVTLEAEAILAQLRAGVALVDRVLAERSADKAAPAASPGLAQHQDLLELLQTMAGLAMGGRAELLPVMASQIGSTLKRYRVQVRHFASSLTPAERDDFDTEPDVTGTLRQPRGELPALLADGRCILRGRVILPRSS